MIGLVLVSHGHLADSLLAATTMIVGEQTQTAVVALMPGMTPESLQMAVMQAIESVDRGEGVLLLADLFGGTPARVISEQVLLRHMPAISGMNLPMLLEVCIREKRQR